MTETEPVYKAESRIVDKKQAEGLCMNELMKVPGVSWVRKNTDTKIVVSGVMTAAAIGGILYLAQKSGVKPLRQAASVVRQGV